MAFVRNFLSIEATSRSAIAGILASCGPTTTSLAYGRDLRRVIAVVALLNILTFGVEFSVAIAIGSVSLFADSVDFFEDASVNLLIFSALTWSAAHRARAGMALAAILLLPALAFVWALWSKFHSPVPLEPVPLTITGFGALAVNLRCAFLLVRYRHHSGDLITSCIIGQTRIDALANIAIIGARLVTLFWPSVWPDVLVGIGVGLLNLDAAKEVWTAARAEHRVAVGG